MRRLPYWRLSGYYFFYFAFIGAFSPYFGLYLEALTFSAWDIGLLMSQMQLMRLCAPYLWGALADRLGQRIGVVRLASVLSVVAFCGIFPAREFLPMLLTMALLAFFWSGALPLVEALTFDHLRDSRGHYSRIRLWGSIGFILAVMTTGVVLDQWALNELPWVIVATLSGIVVCALLVPEAPRQPTSEERRAIGVIVRQRRVLVLFSACFLMSAAHGALYVFFSIHLAGHQYSNFAVGCLWSLGVVAEIIIFVFMSGLLRHFGLRSLLLASFAAAVVRFLLIGWQVDTALWIVVAQLLHGLTFGAYHASAIAAVNGWFSGSCQVRGQALYSSVSFGAGGLVGGLVSGAAWGVLGPALTFTLSSVFALLGLALVALAVKNTDFDPVAGEAQSVGEVG